MQNNTKFPHALRATLVGMPPTRAPRQTRAQLADLARSGTSDGDSLGAQAVEQICRDYLDVIAELAAARAQVASLQRQLTLKVEAVAFAVVAAPRRRPHVIRREPITKVMPCAEVQP